MIPMRKLTAAELDEVCGGGGRGGLRIRTGDVRIGHITQVGVAVKGGEVDQDFTINTGLIIDD